MLRRDHGLLLLLDRIIGRPKHQNSKQHQDAEHGRQDQFQWIRHHILLYRLSSTDTYPKKKPDLSAFTKNEVIGRSFNKTGLG